METVTETKKRGRKAKGAKAMSGRTRTQLYRQRRKRETIDAIGQEAGTSTVVLVELLKIDLARLEGLLRSDDLAVAENVTVTKSAVTRILRELCHRYEIEL